MAEQFHQNRFDIFLEKFVTLFFYTYGLTIENINLGFPTQ